MDRMPGRTVLGVEGLTGPRAHTPVELVLWPLTSHLLSLTVHIVEN